MAKSFQMEKKQINPTFIINNEPSILSDDELEELVNDNPFNIGYTNKASDSHENKNVKIEKKIMVKNKKEEVVKVEKKTMLKDKKEEIVKIEAKIDEEIIAQNRKYTKIIKKLEQMSSAHRKFFITVSEFTEDGKYEKVKIRRDDFKKAGIKGTEISSIRTDLEKASIIKSYSKNNEKIQNKPYHYSI